MDVLTALCFILMLDSYVAARGPLRYTVALNVFSGRENPKWIVDDENPLYSRISYGLGQMPSTRLNERLGYQGFAVEIRNVFGQRAMKTIAAGSSPRMEMLLLKSSPFPLEPAVRRHVMETLHRQMPKLFQTSLKLEPGLAKDGFSRAVCRLPRFDPDRWNVPPTITRNNCYNYATQRMTNTFAQPGRASGRPFRRRDLQVYYSTLSDGFVPMAFYSPRIALEGTCYMALVIWPGVDFHFYRLDDNLLWSHKPGRTPAKNVDNSGNLIADPRTADRGQYVVFAGYLRNHPHARVI